MKSKIFTLLFAIVVSIGTMFAGSGTCGENLTWELTNGVLTISGSGEMEDYWYYYPSSNAPWFSQRNNITTLIIDNGVTSIGNNAFYGCKITSIELPNSVARIGESAFIHCTSLTSIEIPNSVASIGNSAFYGCSGLTSVEIPNSVTSIGSSAFSSCSNLQFANIDATSIGTLAFSDCGNLTNVTIGLHVTNIGDLAFGVKNSIGYGSSDINVKNVVWNAKKCNACFLGPQVESIIFGEEVEEIPAGLCSGMTLLTSIVIPYSVIHIGRGAFAGCTGLTTPLYSARLFAYMPTSISGEYDIPSGIEIIADGAFENCRNLTAITIPNSVTKIGNFAFYFCNGLTSVTIPNSVKSIGVEAFYECSALSSVLIENGVESIEDEAFENCRNLTAITIPTSVKSIGYDVFVGSRVFSINVADDNAYFSSVDNVLFNKDKTTLVVSAPLKSGDYNIPNGVTNIRKKAFAECYALTSVTIPNGVTHIGDASFVDCNRVVTVNIPNSVIHIGKGAFRACKKLNSIVIPDSVTSIEDSTFYGCSSLISATIEDGVKRIDSYAFYDCNLSFISIPNSVTSIGSRVFESNFNLTSVSIGSGITLIGPEAFYITNALSISELICHAVTPPQVSAPGTGIHRGKKVYVPIESVELYTSDDSWKNFDISSIGSISPKHAVLFYDWNNTVISAQQVEEGHSATAPANPTREGYTFTGWDKDFSNIQSDLIVTAQYRQNTPGATYYTVTFKDWDGTVLKTQQVEKGKSATAPANPTREGYTFIGWDKSFTNVQSNLIVTAQYTQNTPIATYYTVTFKDWDGAVLKAEQVEEGHAATAPANPTREGYTFVGWDKDFSHVLSDLIVMALYTQNAPVATYYTVIFKDWDGTALKAEQVENGKSATAPATPTREGYTFIGWDKSSANVQSDLIVTAQYIQNSSEPAGEASFIGFESTSENPLSNQIYAENLIQNKVNVTLVETDATKHKYSINLTNGGEGSFTMGGVSFSYTYSQAGKTAYKTYIEYIQPNGADREISIPTKTGEQVKVVLVEACAGVLVNGVSTDFVAGDNVLTSQSGTIVLKSASTKPKISAILPLSSASATNYTVAFVDWDATVLKTQQVAKGQSATAPANPTREDYTFTGWDKDFSNVQSNLIVIAQYTQNAPTYYTVTFKDWDGTVLKNEQVEKGKSATAPANPTREGYTFVGWDKYFGNVRSDLIVTALYTQNASTYYTVTFKDWDGTVLKTEQVEEGTIPSYTGATPTRQETAEFTYTFAGWTPEIAAATSDATYTATYTATRKSYTITWLQDDGSLIDQTTVEYGQTPTHADPTKAATAEYTYTFAGWTPEIVVVTKDATYTATYEATPVSEGVEDVSADDIAPRKVMIDGNVYILRGEKVYTLQGHEVK